MSRSGSFFFLAGQQLLGEFLINFYKLSESPLKGKIIKTILFCENINSSISFR